MQNRKLFGAVLAASLSLATLASCATPTPAGVNSSAGVSQKSGTSSTAAGTFAGPVSAGSNASVQGSGSSDTLAVKSADASVATAQALAAERAMDDYSVSIDGTAASPYYTLAGFRGEAEGGASLSHGGGDTSATANASATGAANVGGRGAPGSERSATGAANANDDHKGGRADGGATDAQGPNGKSNEGEHGGRGHGAAHIDAALKSKLEGRREGAKEKASKRLRSDESKSLKDAAQKAGWVTNADGTKTKTIETDVTLTVNAKTTTRHVKMVRTLNADGVLSSEIHDFTETLADGANRTSHREKTLNADGSYTVVFTSTTTFADKSSRTAVWNKTIGADGGVTGTGTITWTDSAGAVTKTVKITLGGSEDEQAANPGDDKKPAVTADDDKDSAPPAPAASATPVPAASGTPAPAASSTPAPAASSTPTPAASATPTPAASAAATTTTTTH
jgi:hypothetical protein